MESRSRESTLILVELDGVVDVDEGVGEEEEGEPNSMVSSPGESARRVTEMGISGLW